jgi:hypothetical protein
MAAHMSAAEMVEPTASSVGGASSPAAAGSHRCSTISACPPSISLRSHACGQNAFYVPLVHMFVPSLSGQTIVLMRKWLRLKHYEAVVHTPSSILTALPPPLPPLAWVAVVAVEAAEPLPQEPQYRLAGSAWKACDLPPPPPKAGPLGLCLAAAARWLCRRDGAAA